MNLLKMFEHLLESVFQGLREMPEVAPCRVGRLAPQRDKGLKVSMQVPGEKRSMSIEVNDQQIHKTARQRVQTKV